MSCKEEASWKKKWHEHILFLTFDFAPVSDRSHNDKVRNWTTCWKDTTTGLLMPVQLSMKQLKR